MTKALTALMTTISAAKVGPVLLGLLLFTGLAKANDCSGGFIEVNGARQCFRQATPAEREAYRQYATDKAHRRDQAILEARERQAEQDRVHAEAVREYQKRVKIDRLKEQYKAQDRYVQEGIYDSNVNSEEFSRRLDVRSDIHDQMMDVKYKD